MDTIFRHPATNRPAKRQEGKNPDLFKKNPPSMVDDAWTSNIMYLQMWRGNLYLCCLMDWVEARGSRMDPGDEHGDRPLPRDPGDGSGRRAQTYGFHTDQGSQYTSAQWAGALASRGITVSMDGKGCWADNIAMERFWRTYKHDFFLLREFCSLEEGAAVDL